MKDKQSSQIARGPTYSIGSDFVAGFDTSFQKVAPEIFNRIPAPVSGKKVYVRFGLSMLLRQERNNDGQLVMLQIPSIDWIEKDELETKSIPSSAASTLAGSGMAAKPATPTTAPAAPGKS